MIKGKALGGGRGNTALIVTLPTAVAASSDSGRARLRSRSNWRFHRLLVFYRPNFFFHRGVVACTTGGKTGQKIRSRATPGERRERRVFLSIFPAFYGQTSFPTSFPLLSLFPRTAGGFSAPSFPFRERRGQEVHCSALLVPPVGSAELVLQARHRTRAGRRSGSRGQRLSYRGWQA